MREFNDDLETSKSELTKSSWAFNFLKRANEKGFNIVLNDEKMIDISSSEESNSSPELLRMLNLVSVPLQKIIEFKGQYYTDALTRSEFKSSLSEFRIFASLWEDGEASNDNSLVQSFTWNDSGAINLDQLFYFFGRNLQSQNFRELLKSDLTVEYSLDHSVSDLSF